ncbi:tRNA 2-selenouridine(34) synthase MnmH [Bdellovibrio sp. HCB185ZH]|uniref:tRNA 2-selenouridine(34) synthase MnmH n=1 Tax=Bdellovibrio sp. HCB185ZH TaxID=3394235 RepID=UPI0039A72B3D
MKNLPTLSPEDLWTRLLHDSVRIIDVRAPVEFAAGSIPCSSNHPIMNDKERAEVGTAYKMHGQQHAIELGHSLVQGPIKEERVKAWIQEYQKDPAQTIVTCFRGGLRSQITQTWLREKGIDVLRVAGGYKKTRQLLIDKIDEFCKSRELVVLTGKTGVGKTQLLSQVHTRPLLDLEALAKHRGSAFGGYSEPQPSQIDFENGLAVSLGKFGLQSFKGPILVEDESRLIGRCVLPDNFFAQLRESPVLVLEESLEVRVENTFQEYVVAPIADPTLFPKLQENLAKIKNKLGGLRYSEIASDLKTAEQSYNDHRDLEPCKVWIEKLITWYYDPMYESSFQKRNPRILSKGNRQHILQELQK